MWCQSSIRFVRLAILPGFIFSLSPILVELNVICLFPLSLCVCVCCIVQVSVTSLNFVSQANSEVPIIPTVIAFVAFSDQGQWMATVRIDKMQSMYHVEQSTYPV